MKYVCGQSFIKFREVFKAEFQKGFICRSSTFDNVKGQFPIGFTIWNLQNKKEIQKIKCDIFDSNGNIEGKKSFISVKKGQLIIDWLRQYFDKNANKIGYLRFLGTDFQANSYVFITSQPSESDFRESKVTEITINNLIAMCVYFAVRKVIPSTWLNDRDQFLYPNKKWAIDAEFHNDCLAYTIFNNNISSKHGVNYWIPFAEPEVNARTEYSCHTMISFLSGEKVLNAYADLFSHLEENKKYPSLNWVEGEKREFSIEAKAVFDAGRELWKYYHAQKIVNVNASLYDIREYFQGRNDKGKMNNKSDDENYNELIGALRDALSILAKKIEPKVYEYGFLMR
jgi:hypothetical protein